jgi:twitching motility protein PilT
MNIQELLSIAVERDASDLHIITGYVPTLRIHGELRPLITLPILIPEEVEQMVFSLINPTQKELLITNKELDFSYTASYQKDSAMRFRVNIYYQMNQMAAAFRLIPSKIQSIEELGLPPILHEFAKLRSGFILVTGPTGQGKSTTIASILQEINTTRNVHIITVEDPVEYVYSKKKAIVSQREVYTDTHSWNNSLRNILREDPDVVFVGEMRDYETVASALTIAETGHLVFSTLHTNTAAQTIDRILDIFPPNTQSQVRMQLSMVISGIVAQRLVPTISNERIPVCEILLANPSVRNTIRDGKTHLIDNIIQTSKDLGMLLFEDSLREMVQQNIIAHDVALEYALRPDQYLQLIQH